MGYGTVMSPRVPSRMALLGMESSRAVQSRDDQPTVGVVDQSDRHVHPPLLRSAFSLEPGPGGDVHPRLTLTVEEAAHLLGISRALAYDMVTRGDLPHVRLGRRILVSRRVLEAMIDRPDRPA